MQKKVDRLSKKMYIYIIPLFSLKLRSNRPLTLPQTNGRFPLPPRAQINWRNKFGCESTTAVFSQRMDLQF